uniref:SGNH hydrolase-type esterase domain-containing protein n=1 Tax=Noctiluca scintillans TaxID=2966 RepID=A0A7S1AFI3_NOCSC|mmetsp:Transcript_44225/g.117178  ORF Transcript_44225/g.117178 Transcript_44225/m.117178 type:complete len:599 (+) Transcript_44225:118-1914(+)
MKVSCRHTETVSICAPSRGKVAVPHHRWRPQNRRETGRTSPRPSVISPVNVALSRSAHVSTRAASPTRRRSPSPIDTTRATSPPPPGLASLATVTYDGEPDTPRRALLSLNRVSYVPPVEGVRADPRYCILCYGDSITTGFCRQGSCYEPYGQHLAKELRAGGVASLKVGVHGLNGLTASDFAWNVGSSSLKDTTGQVGKGLGLLLSENNVDLVIITAGTNDIHTGVGPRPTFSSICALHAECHNRGVSTVVLAPPTVSQGPAHVARVELVVKLAAWAERTPAVKAFVDPETIMPRETCCNLWDPDGIHLSSMGSRQLGSRLAATLAPVIRASRECVSVVVPSDKSDSSRSCPSSPRRDAAPTTLRVLQHQEGHEVRAATPIAQRRRNTGTLIFPQEAEMSAARQEKDLSPRSSQRARSWSRLQPKDTSTRPHSPAREAATSPPVPPGAGKHPVNCDIHLHAPSSDIRRLPGPVTLDMLNAWEPQNAPRCRSTVSNKISVTQSHVPPAALTDARHGTPKAERMYRFEGSNQAPRGHSLGAAASVRINDCRRDASPRGRPVEARTLPPSTLLTTFGDRQIARNVREREASPPACSRKVW